MARRLECFDGLRGLLALYVLISHMAPFAGLPAWMTRPFSHGEAAVDLFFVLSGMVIVLSFESAGWATRPFLRARAARTIPAFLAVFACAVPVQALPTALPQMPWVVPDDPGRAIWSEGWPHHWAAEIGAHLVMAHGLLPVGLLPGAWVSFLGSAWSLSTEWQFYLAAALAGPAMRRRGAPLMVRAFLLAAALALAWRWAAPAGWQFSRAFLPNKAAYFALGMASAAWPGRSGRGALGATLAATLLLCFGAGGAGKLGAPLVWMLCLGAERAPGFPPLRPVSGMLRARPLQALGAASYSIYLVNEPVQKLLALALAPLAGGSAGAFALMWIPGAILLPLGAALLCWRHVERPGLLLARGRLTSGGGRRLRGGLA